MSARVLKAPEVVVSDAAPMPPEAVRSAIEEAFRQGRALGHSEGSAALDEALLSLRSALAAISAEIWERVAAEVRLDADCITSLAADLAGWFLGNTAVADPEIFRAGLQSALTAMGEESNVILELHPSVIEALGDDSRLGPVTIRPDDSLDPSDFRMSGNATSIERRWCDAIADMRPDLVEAVRADRSIGD